MRSVPQQVKRNKPGVFAGLFSFCLTDIDSGGALRCRRRSISARDDVLTVQRNPTHRVKPFVCALAWQHQRARNALVHAPHLTTLRDVFHHCREPSQQQYRDGEQGPCKGTRRRSGERGMSRVVAWRCAAACVHFSFLQLHLDEGILSLGQEDICRCEARRVVGTSRQLGLSDGVASTVRSRARAAGVGIHPREFGPQQKHLR